MRERYEIAEWVFELRLPEGPLAAEVRAALAPFSSRNPPDTLLEVFLDQALPGAGEPDDTLPEVFRTSDDGLCVRNRYFEAQVTADRREVSIHQSATRFPIDSVLKVLLADRLLERNGLLIHSVGISNEDAGLVFTGQSGAGKSTLGALCVTAGLRRLSDELVAVFPVKGDGYVVHGTPWNIGGPWHAKLRGLGLLAFGASPKLNPLPGSEVLRVLIVNCLLPDLSAPGRARIFRAATDLVRSIASLRLTFAKDAGVAEVLRARLEL